TMHVAPSESATDAATTNPSAPIVPHAAAAKAVAAPSRTADHNRPEMASLLATGVATSAAGAGTDLIEMFDELKGELEEDAAPTTAEQDPDTDYNLGIAVR